MAESTNNKVPSEEELGEKWDRCVADTILKTGTGIGVGLVCSLLLKRRLWPVAMGTGFGMGYAVSNCQHDFRRVNSAYLKPRVSNSTGEPSSKVDNNTVAAPTTITTLPETAPEVTPVPTEPSPPMSNMLAGDGPAEGETPSNNTKS